MRSSDVLLNCATYEKGGTHAGKVVAGQRPLLWVAYLKSNPRRGGSKEVQLVDADKGNPTISRDAGRDLQSERGLASPRL